MNKIGKIVTIILWVLLIISAVFIVSLIANIGEDTDPIMGSWIDSNLVWAYILVAVGAGIAILAGIVHMVTDKNALKGGIISLVFMAAVALVAYLLASSEIPQFVGVDKFINDGTLNERVAKLVDTGLYATYILLALAILSIAFSSVARLFR